MKTIASRMLTAAPGKVWAELEREGALVVTKDGVPRSIMIPTSDATLFEDIGEIVFARARRAVRAMRTQTVGHQHPRLRAPLALWATGSTR